MAVHGLIDGLATTPRRLESCGNRSSCTIDGRNVQPAMPQAARLRGGNRRGLRSPRWRKAARASPSRPRPRQSSKTGEWNRWTVHRFRFQAGIAYLDVVVRARALEVLIALCVQLANSHSGCGYEACRRPRNSPLREVPTNANRRRRNSDNRGEQKRVCSSKCASEPTRISRPPWSNPVWVRHCEHLVETEPKERVLAWRARNDEFSPQPRLE